jgi:aminocarboxymuconate-semialdehyde decarboxylase|tara:strand:- start:361 stop:1350 length:990 start_codon:yes stop_codon:yes gene_type:complete
MKIDMHTHVAPREAIKIADKGGDWHGINFSRDDNEKLTTSYGNETMPLPWPKKMETPSERLKSMDDRKVDMHILSLSPLMHWHGLDKDNAISYAKDVNDDISDYTNINKSRFQSFCFLPLQDTDASIYELERCVSSKNMLGAMVATNINGMDWDSDELYPILEAANKLNCLIFFHPTRGRANSWLKNYHLRNLIGNPLETTVAMATIIFSGVMDKLPNLNLCFAHGGGFIRQGIGRFDHGYCVRDEAKSNISQLPSDYLKNFYYDTITHSESGLRNLVDIAGIDQIFLGSDYPADMGEPYPVNFVEDCSSISESEKNKIFKGNIKKFLK